MNPREIDRYAEVSKIHIYMYTKDNILQKFKWADKRRLTESIFEFTKFRIRVIHWR